MSSRFQSRSFFYVALGICLAVMLAFAALGHFQCGKMTNKIRKKGELKKCHLFLFGIYGFMMLLFKPALSCTFFCSLIHETIAIKIYKIFTFVFIRLCTTQRVGPLSKFFLFQGIIRLFSKFICNFF